MYSRKRQKVSKCLEHKISIILYIKNVIQKENYHDMLKKAMLLLTKLPCSTKQMSCSFKIKSVMLVQKKIP